MAQLLVSGTKLQARPAKAPLNRRFIFALGVIYLLAIHLPWPMFSLLDRPTNRVMPTNLITWISFSLIISLGLVQVLRHRYFRYSKLTIGLFICCALMMLPLIYSGPQWSEVSTRLIGLWAGVLLFVLLQQFLFSNRHKQRIIWFIVLAGWIEAIRGYLLLDHLQQQFLPLGELTHLLHNHHVITTFHDSNSIATLLSTATIASGYLLCRLLKKYSQFKTLAILYATPAVMLPLIFLHSPIITTLTTLGCGLMMLPYFYRFASVYRLRGWSASLLIGIICCGLMFAYSGLTNLSQERAKLSAYLTSIKQSANMMIEKPFTGYGYGRFDEEYVLYSARQHQLNPSFPPALPEHTHPQNEPLFWAVEGGMVPFLAITLASMMVIARIISAKKGSRLASFALLLPIAIQAQFSTIFYVSSIHWITFIILLFWVDQRVARYRTQTLLKWQKRIISLATVLIPSMSIVTISIILHDQHRLTQFHQSHDNERLNQLFVPSIWQDELKEFSLVNAVQQTNSDHIITPSEADIDWLLNKIKLHPRPYYYQLLIELYYQLGDDNRALQTQTEAQYLFPTETVSSIGNSEPDDR
jgi:O-antigen polymerase